MPKMTKNAISQKRKLLREELTVPIWTGNDWLQGYKPPGKEERPYAIIFRSPYGAFQNISLNSLSYFETFLNISDGT